MGNKWSAVARRGCPWLHPPAALRPPCKDLGVYLRFPDSLPEAPADDSLTTYAPAQLGEGGSDWPSPCGGFGKCPLEIQVHVKPSRLIWEQDLSRRNELRILR